MNLKFSGYPVEQIKPYLMNLANKGFLFYNSVTDKVTVQEKFKNYVNAELKKGDYDVIRFQSKITQSLEDNSFIVNSLLNLDSRELEIKGVNYISISDSQKVYIQPYGGLIKVKKNRDFDFSGKISVGLGRFILFGQEFKFKYDDFKIDLK